MLTDSSFASVLHLTSSHPTILMLIAYFHVLCAEKIAGIMGGGLEFGGSLLYVNSKHVFEKKVFSVCRVQHILVKAC